MIAGAIAGGVAGGLITYFGDRSLEHERTIATARGTARVLESQLASASVRLEVMIEERRLHPPDAYPPITLSLDDQKVIATRLTAEEWTAVAVALVLLRRESQDDSYDMRRAISGTRVDLSAEALGYYRDIAGAVREALYALAPLTGSRLTHGR